MIELSEHLWPEDLELAIPVVHDVARSYQNPLLLLVEVFTSFDTSPFTFLCQILQPGILAHRSPKNAHQYLQDKYPKSKFASLTLARDPRPKLGFYRSRRPIACLRFLASSITSGEMRHSGAKRAIRCRAKFNGIQSSEGLPAALRRKLSEPQYLARSLFRRVFTHWLRGSFFRRLSWSLSFL